MSEIAKTKIVQTTIVEDLTRRRIVERFHPFTHEITAVEQRFDVVIETMSDGFATVTLRPKGDSRYVRDSTSMEAIISAKDSSDLHEYRVRAMLAKLATDNYKEIARRLRNNGSVTL